MEALQSAVPARLSAAGRLGPMLKERVALLAVGARGAAQRGREIRSELVVVSLFGGLSHCTPNSRKLQLDGRQRGSFLATFQTCRITSSSVRRSTMHCVLAGSCLNSAEAGVRSNSNDNGLELNQANAPNFAADVKREISSHNSTGESSSCSTRRQLIALAAFIPLSTSLCLQDRTAEAAEVPPNVRGDYPPSESMSLAENVRLEDVDSRDLQEALEAAIGGDLERADYLFGQLIESYPESASMWSNRGSVRLSMGKFQEAASDFTRAIELAPYAAVPFLNRAIAYEAMGQYDEAVEDCTSAIGNDPHESAAWFNLGNIQTKREKYREALDAYQTAADLSPGIAGYRLREANSLFQVGFANDAEKLIRGIVRKYPNYAEAHAALAGMLWGDGRLSLAEEQLTEATEFEPNFKNMRWVNDNVEWPPKLLKVYNDLLKLK